MLVTLSCFCSNSKENDPDGSIYFIKNQVPYTYKACTSWWRKLFFFQLTSECKGHLPLNNQLLLFQFIGSSNYHCILSTVLIQCFKNVASGLNGITVHEIINSSKNPRHNFYHKYSFFLSNSNTYTRQRQCKVHYSISLIMQDSKDLARISIHPLFLTIF